jgi:hypothetical protein
MNQPESIDTELLRNACNAAFHELGLDWYWDTGQPLPGAGTGREGMLACVRDYLTANQSHMLKAYDAGFLADAILAAMARCTQPAAAADWCALQQRQIGI